MPRPSTYLSLGERLHRPALVCALLLGACGAEPDPPPYECIEDSCNAAESRDELLEAVTDFGDPIAAYLREAVRPDGSLEGDYLAILDGVGELMGCPESSQRSFMVLSNESLNPKSIFNRCADSPINASEFFLLLPSLDRDKDFEPELVHMTAWDEEAQVYRRYSTFPKEEGGMSVNVEPGFCLGCHGGPRNLDTWQPLMNEMTNPWSQWNAEPGFQSHVFDEYLPAVSAAGDVFAEVSAEGLLDSASNFEPIIRSGIDRVTGARVKRRHRDANIEETLELLQPLFCDEHVNFVSEIHRSGELRSSVLVDDSLRELFTAMEVGGTLDFVSDTSLRLAPPSSEESNLTLMSVRGESTLRAELALVTRQALSPLQVLQVRSLDWARPVDSDFRCGLFEAAEVRIAAGALDESLAALPADATNAMLLPAALTEIMQYQGQSLQPAGEAVYALAEPDAFSTQTLAQSLQTPEAFAQTIQEHVDNADRSALEIQRKERACAARARYPTAPIVPDISCP